MNVINKKTHLGLIILIVCTFVLAGYFYRHFPAQVPLHWNINGVVDRYGSRTTAAFLFPSIIVGIYLIFLAVPLIDPRKERYSEFKKAYNVFTVGMIAFMTLMYLFIGLIGLGYHISIIVVIPVMVGILFIVIGNYLSKIKNNWFIGVRNPWTLSQENVWNKTHRLTSKVFILGGIALALTALLPSAIRLATLIAVIFCMVAVPNIYSYMIFSKSRSNDLTSRDVE